MRRKIISLTCISVLFLSAPYNVQADSLSDSKTKYTEVSSSLKELDNQIADIKASLDSLNQKISENQAEIDNTKEIINKKEEEIQSLNTEINDNQDLLDRRLREMYKNGSNYSTDILSFLIKSDSLNDLISRFNSAKTIINLDHKLINDTKNKVSQAEDSKKEIEDKKNNLELLNSEIQTDLDNVNSKNKELEDKKSKLTSELSKLSDVIEANENNLVKRQISVIGSSNDYNELEMAVSTLEALLPQLSVQSVINSTNSAIKNGKDKLGSMKAPDTQNASRGEGGAMPAINPSAAKKTLTLEATAYTAHTTTAMGTIPVRNPNGLSSVAVDKNVIPLGSKVYVSGYGYAIACDTGSDIVGNRIDLFMNSEAECLSFGRKTVTVYIIAYPEEW